MSDTSNVLHAFTAGQVARLTGLSDRQLAYWNRTGFFVPWHAAEDRRSSYSCLYSFKDVVGLRTLSILKGRHGVSLPHLISTLAISGWVARGFGEAVEERAGDCRHVPGIRGR